MKKRKTWNRIGGTLLTVILAFHLIAPFVLASIYDAYTAGFIYVTLVFHLTAPFVLLGWLMFNRGKSRLYKAAIALFVTSFLFMMKSGGAGWHWFGVWWPALFIVLLIPAWIFFIKNFTKAPWLPEKKIFPWLGIVLLLIFSGDFIRAIAQFGAMSEYEGESVKLSFPLAKGIYYIIHGGNSSAGNHHYPVSAQKYALDIVKLNAYGMRAKGLVPSDLSRYEIFADKLFAPCSGEILSARNHLSDKAPSFQLDLKNIMGNHVIIYCKGYSVALAHLKKGSVPVSSGDYVEAGEFVGEVGNSGRSSEPHLHIHAVKGRVNDEKEIVSEALGVAMIFKDRFLARGDRFKNLRKSQTQSTERRKDSFERK